MVSVTASQIGVFLRYAEKTPTHWVWQGPLSQKGYPRLCADGGRYIRASHVAVTLDGVEIPEGHEVSPICGHKICVNPAHLEVIESSEARRKPRKPRFRRVIEE